MKSAYVVFPSRSPILRVIVSCLVSCLSYTLLMGSPRFCIVVPVSPSYSLSGVSHSFMLSFSL